MIVVFWSQIVSRVMLQERLHHMTNLAISSVIDSSELTRVPLYRRVFGFAISNLCTAAHFSDTNGPVAKRQGHEEYSHVFI